MTDVTDPSAIAWRSLVDRSLLAWDYLYFTREGDGLITRREKEFLQSWCSIDEFLEKTAKPGPFFWFFQGREAFLAQKTMRKWSRDRLDEYILLPATWGFVSRKDCFFISHYWRHDDEPDPDGTTLRLHQACLGPQEWSYVWVDWTCTPQAPRSEAESIYFDRSLETVSGLIRECGFSYFYPPFEPRLWILYEIAEYMLTAEKLKTMTDDLWEFARHVHEMVQTSVRSVLERYHYRCKNDIDKAFLTSWLELLVLLKRLNLDLFTLRRLLGLLTWNVTVQSIVLGVDSGGLRSSRDVLQIEKFKGKVTHRGEVWTFTPFPIWVSPFFEGDKQASSAKGTS